MTSAAAPVHKRVMTTLPRLALPAALAVPALPAAAQTAAAQTAPASTAAAAVDYREAASWLCRPGRKDACAVDQTATVVGADGKMTRESFRAASRPAVDCFYVYPTVSADLTPNSDMTVNDEERRVVEQQFARFASQCHLFAPMYRQVTLTALRAGMGGTIMPGIDRDLGYNDVKAAWNDYLARDNKGRGVVLIGHSQGSGVLKRLIAEEIDGKPVQARMVSALLIGNNIAVPKGQDVGGDFKSVPLCRSRTQVGCLVTYVSFRDTAPPPANSRFGKVSTAGQTAACVNPAALAGGPAPLQSYLSNRAIVASAAPTKPWTTDGKAVTTPFVSTPNLLTGECVTGDAGSYLSVKVNADPADPRTDEIAGDVVAGNTILADWGLHLIDMNVAMGDLVSLVGDQSNAYTPPPVWTWNKESGGRFAAINRPIAGPTREQDLPVGRHPLQLYSLATPNGVKVTVMLEELLAAGHTGAEYDAWLIRINEGDQFTSGFVSANPNSKIPALVDRSGPEPIRVFESGAILVHLAEKFGAFLPREPSPRAETLAWLFWQMGAAPYLGGGFGHFYAYAPTKIEYAIDRFAMEVKRQLDVLNRRLAESEYLAGPDYTIADMAVWPWYGALVKGMVYEAGEFLSVHEYTHVIRWTDQIAARPAVKRGRMVNRVMGDPSSQLHERHDASDFDLRTADKLTDGQAAG